MSTMQPQSNITYSNVGSSTSNGNTNTNSHAFCIKFLIDDSTAGKLVGIKGTTMQAIKAESGVSSYRIERDHIVSNRQSCLIVIVYIYIYIFTRIYI